MYVFDLDIFHEERVFVQASLKRARAWKEFHRNCVSSGKKELMENAAKEAGLTLEDMENLIQCSDFIDEISITENDVIDCRVWAAIEILSKQKIEWEKVRELIDASQISPLVKGFSEVEQIVKLASKADN